MPIFVLRHQHADGECAVAVAAWRGHPSALRGTRAWRSCAHAGHDVVFVAEAADGDAALSQLPAWLAARTSVLAVDEIRVP